MPSLTVHKIFFIDFFQAGLKEKLVDLSNKLQSGNSNLMELLSSAREDLLSLSTKRDKMLAHEIRFRALDALDINLKIDDVS